MKPATRKTCAGSHSVCAAVGSSSSPGEEGSLPRLWLAGMLLASAARSHGLIDQ